jgi:hypothetical protein
MKIKTFFTSLLGDADCSRICFLKGWFNFLSGGKILRKETKEAITHHC